MKIRHKKAKLGTACSQYCKPFFSEKKFVFRMLYKSEKSVYNIICYLKEE